MLTTNISELNLIESILTDYFNQDQVTHFTLLRETDYNAVYLVELTEGKRILRIRKRAEKQDVEFEVDVIQFLTENNIPTQRCYPSRAGESVIETAIGPAALYEYIEGEAVYLDNGFADKKITRKAGELLGRMHNVGSSCDEMMTRKNSFGSGLSEIYDLKSEISKKYVNGKEFIREIESCFEFIKKDVPRRQFGLLQNDYRPQNLLLHEKENEIKAIIDFDWCVYGPLIWDLALAAIEWSYPDGGEFNESRFRAFLEGYNKTAERKIKYDENLIGWMKAVSLDAACTYLTRNLWEKDEIRSYMYRKYKYFKDIK